MELRNPHNPMWILLLVPSPAAPQPNLNFTREAEGEPFLPPHLPPVQGHRCPGQSPAHTWEVPFCSFYLRPEYSCEYLRAALTSHHTKFPELDFTPSFPPLHYPQSKALNLLIKHQGPIIKSDSQAQLPNEEMIYLHN